MAFGRITALMTPDRKPLKVPGLPGRPPLPGVFDYHLVYLFNVFGYGFLLF
jgi:hypothetical protein